MKALVVGHRGYVGPLAVKHLKRAGFEVHGLDEGWYDECIRGLNADHIPDSEHVSDYAKVSDLDTLPSYDVVVWLAGVSNDHMGNVDETDTFWTNYELPRMIANNFWKGNPKGRFVYISSASVYGDNGTTATEETEVSPLTAYSKSKTAMDGWLSSRTESWVSLRYGTLWGASPNMRRDLVVNAFTWEAIHTRVIKPQSTARRPIFNVDDAGWVTALASVLPNVQGVYNACAENVTVTQIAKRIADFTGTQVLDYVGDDGDKRDYWMDNSRLLYHFEIRPDELVTTDNPIAIKAVESCLTAYRGNLRTRTEIYKEMKGK